MRVEFFRLFLNIVTERYLISFVVSIVLQKAVKILDQDPVAYGGGGV